jgi:putative Holliday junction resolvase
MTAGAGSTTLQTLLGFDYGKLRIGIAVGQDITGTASALCTLNCPDGRPDWDKISDLIAEWSPSSLVVGLPLHADGSDSATTRDAAKEGHREIPGKNKDGIDAVAARIILQNWLDTTRHV